MRKWIRVLEIYLTVCFALTVLAAGIIAVDCANHARTGAFSLLPELKLAEYRRENLTGTMEEKLAALNEAWDYALDEGFPTILISAILAAAIANLAIVYLARLFGGQMRRRTKILFGAECGISLLIVVVGRIYVSGSAQETWFERAYPAAYLTIHQLFLPALVLAILTAIVKLTRSADNAHCGLYIIAPEGEQANVWMKIIKNLSANGEDWLVDCLDCLYETPLKPKRYRPDELLSALNGNLNVFSARMIAVPPNETLEKPIQTREDYRKSRARSAVFCADGLYFEVFSKDEAQLNALQQSLQALEPEWLSDSSSGRIEFTV